jgi:hypothetical protein
MLNAYAMWNPSSEANICTGGIKHEPFSRLKIMNKRNKRKYIESGRITNVPCGQ